MVVRKRLLQTMSIHGFPAVLAYKIGYKNFALIFLGAGATLETAWVGHILPPGFEKEAYQEVRSDHLFHSRQVAHGQTLQHRTQSSKNSQQ